MKVIKWISRDDSQKYTESVSAMGGWFNDESKGQRWKDYISIRGESVGPYLEAIRQSILEKELRFTGEDHQYSSHGVPLFEDNTVASFSKRGWGDLMAAVWSEKEDKDYSYMDFFL